MSPTSDAIQKAMLGRFRFFIEACYPLIDKEYLNLKKSGDYRLLLGLFFLGAADVMRQIAKFGQGEFRVLYVASLASKGWPPEITREILDLPSHFTQISGNLPRLGDEAMKAGADIFRSFCTGKDVNWPIDLSFWSCKWKNEKIDWD